MACPSCQAQTSISKLLLTVSLATLSAWAGFTKVHAPIHPSYAYAELGSTRSSRRAVILQMSKCNL